MNQRSVDCSHRYGGILALLLAGGMGTRLRSVLPSTPKPLAPLGNRSFIELLLRQLKHQGIRRVVMCTGHLGEQIESELGDGEHLGMAIRYSRESSPMGTGGAIKSARHYIGDEPQFLVLNGDSFVELRFREFIESHSRHEGVASIAVKSVDNAARYGTIRVDTENRIMSFEEKTGCELPGLVNAGVYVFNNATLDYIEEGPKSLERDVFPRLLERGVYAVQQHGAFIDIGTPEDYARAQDISDRLYEAALRLE